MKIVVIAIGFIMYNLRRIILYCINQYHMSDYSELKANLGGGVYYSHPENIVIGNNTYINGGQLHAGSKSRIIIGNDCLISYNVHIRTKTHVFNDAINPINKQGEREEDIVIGNNVWIGYGAQILSGVSIGDGSIIAAGAVVNKNVGKNEIWGGYTSKIYKNEMLVY